MTELPPQPICIEVEDVTQVHSARGEAVRIAKEAGMTTAAADAIALAATELAENLHRHAVGGQLFVVPPRPRGDGRLWVVALDRGPGVEHFERCLTDGYSTVGTLGSGLGAVRRLAADFDAASEPGRGTVVCAGFRHPTDAADRVRTPFDVGVFGLAIDSETVNGDDVAAVRRGSVVTVMVADGLGHGPLAAAASATAAAAFDRHADLPPGQLISLINASLVAGRGAAVVVAGLDLAAARDGGTLRTAGLGNVSVLTAAPDGTTRRVPTPHGTAGARMGASAVEQSSDFPPHGVLVLHTDGLTTRWGLEDRAGLLRHRAVVIAAALWRDHLRGSDDSMILVAKAERSEASA